MKCSYVRRDMIVGSGLFELAAAVQHWDFQICSEVGSFGPPRPSPACGNSASSASARSSPWPAAEA